ncbi:NAD(P)-dependent oxidoreductase [Kitasatospora sp. NPDC006697]|uniref:NAD(P)-dependent oxidoreductase n=1 Tax=Kitasatospora sp. NPDC006697 TaxID=3364020 RepID=UPI00368879BE
MSGIVVFGAGGRAGQRVVAEAVARGHRVTAVVRDPAAHPGLAGPGVAVAAGDVTDPASVAALAAGHDAVVQAAFTAAIPSVEFFPAAARALTAGLPVAGVHRLLAVGIGTVLEVAPGVPLHDSAGFPPEHRAFSMGHLVELEVLREAPAELDWVVLAPPPALLDSDSPRTGRYRTGGGAVLPDAEDAPPFRYADLAVALLDELERPAHHRTLVAVGHP